MGVCLTDSTCDLFDRFGEEARVIAAPFIDFGGRTKFVGSVVTVRCFEDNSRIKESVQKPGAGSVLIVDGGGSLRAALLGDMIATAAANAGWEGIIIFGSVRDKAALKNIDLGIKALGTTPRKSVRRGEGDIGSPVQIAGVWIRTGDKVYADEDGIIVLNAEQASLLQATPS